MATRIKRSGRWAVWFLVVLSLVGLKLPDSPARGTVVLAAPAGPSVYGLTSTLGIPASAALDVSDQITGALSRLSRPAIVVLEGMYRIDRTVVISGVNITITGTQATGFVRYEQQPRPSSWPVKVPYYPYLMVQGGAAITLDGFTVKGPLASPTFVRDFESAAGVIVVGGQNVQVRNLRIQGVHGDFVMVNDYFGRPATAVLFEGVQGEVAGRQAAGIVGSNGVTIRGSTFNAVARSGIDVEAATPLGVNNLTIEDSRITEVRGYCLGTHANSHTVIMRRTTCGARGFVKTDLTTGTNHGLVLEDVTYDWRGPWPEGMSPAMEIVLTDGIALLRVSARFNSSRPSQILGAGYVQGSTFVNDGAKPIWPLVCLGPAMSNLNNVGAAPLSDCVPRR